MAYMWLDQQDIYESKTPRYFSWSSVALHITGTNSDIDLFADWMSWHTPGLSRRQPMIISSATESFCNFQDDIETGMWSGYKCINFILRRRSLWYALSFISQYALYMFFILHKLKIVRRGWVDKIVLDMREMGWDRNRLHMGQTKRKLTRMVLEKGTVDGDMVESLTPYRTHRLFWRRFSQPITWLILTNKTVQETHK